MQNGEDKSDTHGAKSVDADLEYLSGFRRRSRCFLRGCEGLDAAMRVFANAYDKCGEGKAERQVPIVPRPTMKTGAYANTGTVLCLIFDRQRKTRYFLFCEKRLTMR